MFKEANDKRVIWSLFDSENATMLQFQGNPNFEAYCFGLGSGSRHISLDLSDFWRAKIELNKYPKPHYIFASPPCESWCYVSVGSKRHYTSEPGITFCWRKKWVPFDFTEKARKIRMNGEYTALTTAKIIQHYQPKFWAIENGTRSLLFDYLREKCNLTGIKNLTNYYSYGFEFLKPTTIYSNIPLSLANNSPNKQLAKVETHVKGMTRTELSSYRSRVPIGLYRDILSLFETHDVSCLFPWGVFHA
jgi:hypothetical protein